MIDDVGYGQMSAFGGLVNTPNIDRLARNGLRYTNMHTTALCSPSRSCMLTGRNHHFILDAHVNAPDKPFFLYCATGAGHAPHQVAPEWIAKYEGAFDMTGLLFIAAAFAIGLLLGGSEPGARSVMALGTAQRNISAALVVGAQNFTDPNVITTLLVGAILLLLALMPTARRLGSRMPAGQAATVTLAPAPADQGVSP